MKILFCTPEVAPFSKTGGLADVAGVLPKALARMGHDIRVVTPLYGAMDRKRYPLRPVVPSLPVRLGSRTFEAAVYEGSPSEPGSDPQVPVYFIDHPAYFARKGHYQEHGQDYPDNLDRFAFFSRAVLETLPQIRWKPDLIHANDWQTALVPVYLKTLLKEDEFYRGMKSLLSLHNLGYQGLFDRELFPMTGLEWPLFSMQGLEYYGKVNLLKGGILFADVLTTVSPNYSREICTPAYGFGLEGVLQARKKDLFGILNGMDREEWNPAKDPWIDRRYSMKNLAGKALCKKGLQKECGLPVSDVPLLGMISRLDEQKGIDLLAEIFAELIQEKLQLVILGTGKPAYHEWLKELSVRYPKKLSVHLTFDQAMAHKIEAGADIFLMPSRYEPCGLNQLYSLQYGTLPVARRTGGLADTIVDFLPSTFRTGQANGFLFEHYAAPDFLKVLLLALRVYEDRRGWRRMMRAAMASDFSWDRSAEAYVRIYQKVVSGA